VARLHWFWRALLAVVVGIVATHHLSWLRYQVGRGIAQELLARRVITAGQAWNLGEYYSQSAGPLITMMTYGLLSLIPRSTKKPSGEILCRKCNHILRGLTEPRCPECGERI